jgi:DNA replication protein DnaC
MMTEPRSKQALSQAYRYTQDRFDRGSVIITTQLPVDRWHEVIGDMTIADAIVDRIINRAHVFKLKGDTMRAEGASSINKRLARKIFLI